MSTVSTQLKEARAAYHELQLGASAVSFTDSSGERVEYRSASVPRLAAYIQDLERQMLGKARRSSLNFKTSKGLT